MRFTIDQLEEHRAVLRTDDAQQLVIPIAELPEGSEEGGVIDLTFHVPSRAATDRTQQAQDVLNEILGSDK